MLSAILFMRRMENVTPAGIIHLDEEEEDAETVAIDVPDRVEVFEINGPVFFGAASKFQDEIRKINMPKILILRMRNVPATADVH